jgi:uncharacterized protein (TIGR02001 family)
MNQHKNKKGLLVRLVLMACFAAHVNPIKFCQAESVSSSKVEVKKLFDLSGSLLFTSDYISRGQTQTFGGPAIQGSLEAQLQGFILGLWGSNVSPTAYPNGSGKELDVYGGYTYQWSNLLSTKVLVYGYFYPGSEFSDPYNGTLDAMDVVPSITYGWVTATYAYSVTDKSGVNGHFAPMMGLDPRGDSRGSWYAEVAIKAPLFIENVFLNVAYGYQSVKNYSQLSYSVFNTFLEYTLPESMHELNLKLGVSTTNNDKKYYTAMNDRGETKDIGRTRVYFTLTKTF